MVNSTEWMGLRNPITGKARFPVPFLRKDIIPITKVMFETLWFLLTE